MMWPNFDGKPYTRDQLAAHINASDFSTWKHKDGSRGKPACITLHNTSIPTIKQWLAWTRAKRQQYIANMQPYYEHMGWLGGPHFFVTPQDDICAFGFNDLMSAGTHASCFNNVSIGIEMGKMCPAFAVEAAAVGVGMLRTHWGPLNSRAAEIRPEADALLQQVAAIVDGAVA
jgi:hypothetical protein